MSRCINPSCGNERAPHNHRCQPCIEKRKARQRATAALPQCRHQGCTQRTAADHGLCGEHRIAAEREQESREQAWGLASKIDNAETLEELRDVVRTIAERAGLL